MRWQLCVVLTTLVRFDRGWGYQKLGIYIHPSSPKQSFTSLWYEVMLWLCASILDIKPSIGWMFGTSVLIPPLELLCTLTIVMYNSDELGCIHYLAENEVKWQCRCLWWDNGTNSYEGWMVWFSRFRAVIGCGVHLVFFIIHCDTWGKGRFWIVNTTNLRGTCWGNYIME